MVGVVVVAGLVMVADIPLMTDDERCSPAPPPPPPPPVT